MTKIKRLLAVVTASMLTLGSISAIKADAVAVFIDDIDVYYTSGMWEEFDDHGHLDHAFQYGGTIDENGKAVYKLFNSKINPGLFEYVECPRQNYTQIEFSEEVTEDEWRSIYNKYSEELGYDEVRFFGCYFQGWNNRDENGEFTFQADDVKDKRTAVKKMCADMMKAGIIKDVLYQRYNAEVGTGCNTAPWLRIDNYTGDVSELQAFFKEYDESFVVEMRNDRYFVDIGVSVEDIRWEISDAFEEKFPGADAYTGFTCDYSGGGDLTSGTFDILTAINEEDSCDTDQSGTVEITDATAILASYANTAAGIAAASAENPMDVNGDGAVGIDDATFVLTVYAELAAGMR